MAELQAEFAGVQIVLLGSFNPAIFQPAWFAAHDLLRAEEVQNANIQIVHQDVVVFRTEAVVLEVLRERFAVTSAETAPTPAIVRDLAVGAFSLLEHTPVHAVGINFFAHYPIKTREAFDGLGWKLAPPQNWGDTLQRPGLRSLTMQGLRPDGRAGYVMATVEPSIRLQPHGVYILEREPDGIIDAKRALAILSDSWDGSLTQAEAVHEQILSLL